MERMKRAERFKDIAGVEEKAKFGETELSFSGFREVEFNERPEAGETKEEYQQRLRWRDENVFMAGLLAAEKNGEEGMVNALNAGNFRIKRMQRREFLSAVAEMSDEEYSAKINGVLGAFGSERSRKVAFSIADSIRDRALELAESDAGNAGAPEARVNLAPEPEPTIERHKHKSHEMTVNDSADVERAEAEASRGWEKGGWYSPVAPERPEIVTPQVEKMMSGEARYYREAKQERRLGRVLAKVKGVFKKEKAVEKARPAKKAKSTEKARPVVRGKYGMERPEGGYFAEPVENDGMPRPEGGYFQRPEQRREVRPEELYYPEGVEEPDYGEPDDFSGDWYSRRSA